MKVLIILASLVSLSLAQGHSNEHHGHWNNLQNNFNDNNNEVYLDIIENYRFEDMEQTDGKHLLIAISDRNSDKACHLIEVGNEWADYLLDDSLTEKVTHELFDLITNHMAQESTLTFEELIQTYGNTQQVRECIQHTVYELFYTPSFTTPRPTTTTPTVPTTTN